MAMDYKKIFGLLFVIAIQFVWWSSAAVTCDVRDRVDCQYTVVCERNAGNAYTPECDFEPNVTFIITKVNVQTLTAGFFGSTNFDSRVRIIKGIENSINTLDPYVFRYYSKTLKMDISSNKIETISNEAFKNLIALHSLNISNNLIETLNRRSLMITETRNTDLQMLDISYNKLTELSGDVFGYLPNLRELYLYHNRLETITEDTFSNVKLLTILDLSYNALSSVNMTLINLTNLKELNLSFNNIAKISGPEINRLAALNVLNLSHNFIDSIESNSFIQAVNLHTVDLSHNRIKSVIEKVMFINNNNLTHLNLKENLVTKIEDNAFEKNRLTYLNLEKNNLTGEITANTFKGLTNVSTINLCNQSITAIRNNAFSDVSNLVYLNLSRNSIKLIENSSFSEVLSLDILDVSYNSLSDVNFLRTSLENLTELYLRHNNVMNISKNAFEKQSAIKKLDISANKIQFIEQNSLPLKSLQYFNVTDNSLSGTLGSNVFSPAKLLRYLDLSSLKLTRIDKLALVDLPGVARLNVSNNIIEYFDPNNLVGMANMFSMDLSYNKLSEFYINNSPLNRLQSIYLNNNNLSDVSKTFVNMTELMYIDLTYNSISDLANVPFKTLTNLKVLHLSHNKIKNFNNPQINSLINLTDLTLSGNELENIDLSYFKNLVLVDLSGNKISNFNHSLFQNLDYLQSLDLSGNNIVEILPGTFQGTKILKLLNLSHNSLSKLRYGTFRGLNRSEVLDLSYNKIAAIDVDVFHECAELKRLTIDYNNLVTLDVERLIWTLPKLSILSLGGNPIACQEIVRNIKTFSRIMFRQVEVTAVHKIFHEDNVHGIKCGDVKAITSTEKSPRDQPSGSSVGLVIWCGLLTIAILAGAGVIYIRKRRKQMLVFRESRLQLRNSLSEFSPNSETHGDLLNL